LGSVVLPCDEGGLYKPEIKDKLMTYKASIFLKV